MPTLPTLPNNSCQPSCQLPRKPSAQLKASHSHIWCIAAFASSLVAAASWITQLVTGGEHAFAVVSNVAFAVDIVTVPLIARAYLVDAHPMVYATTLVSALLAAGSFAHHLDRGHRPAHTLDISLGWVLYVHLALLACYALVQRYVKSPRLLLAFTIVESCGIVALFSFYDLVYQNQVNVLVGAGAFMHLCTLVSRLLNGSAFIATISDFATLVLLQAVATTVQGQLWYRARSPARYNIEHGYWHVLNGTIIGVVVTQTAQILNGVTPVSVTSEWRCRAAIVLFALVLLAATVFNEGEHALTAVLVPAQAAVLLVSGTYACLALRPTASQNTPEATSAETEMPI